MGQLRMFFEHFIHEDVIYFRVLKSDFMKMDDRAIFIGSYTECNPLPHLARRHKKCYTVVF